LAAERSRPPRIVEKEIIKEVPIEDTDKIQELAAEVERLLEELDAVKNKPEDTFTLETPEAIKKLEQRLQEKLDGK
jgi:hypothetical protein